MFTDDPNDVPGWQDSPLSSGAYAMKILKVLQEHFSSFFETTDATPPKPSELQNNDREPESSVA